MSGIKHPKDFLNCKITDAVKFNLIFLYKLMHYPDFNFKLVNSVSDFSFKLNSLQ